MTREEFIQQIAPFVKKYAPQFGIKVYSPIIAQAILESGGGTTYKANFHNYFGLKYRANRITCNNGYFEDGGSEQNVDGSYTLLASDTAWYAFDTMEMGVLGYFQFINIGRYSNVKGVTDQEEYLTRIKEDGYATSINYVKNVMAVIERYNLTVYDTDTNTDYEEMENKKMKINIHAGHNPDGKVACGAVGLIKESTEARLVKNEVIRQLKALGHDIYDCTCDDGTSQSNVLTKIISKCNSKAVDLDVSIHFNSAANDISGNGKTTGVEAYVYSATSSAKKYAEGVCNSISNLGFKNRGVKINSSLYVLRKTSAPAILVECCFVDDKDDVELYDYQSMANAIVYGITGEAYKNENSNEDGEAKDTSAETATNDNTTFYRVQVGAYSVETNAKNMQKRLKADGFEAIITKA